MDSTISSNSTWPRNQAPPRIITPESSQNRAIFTATLANLKQFAKKNDSPKARDLIQAIQNFLSVTDLTTENNVIACEETIRQEPHFDSMILCGTDDDAETRRMESVNCETAISSVLHIPSALPPRIVEPYEPLWVHLAPHFLLTFLTISYLVGGALLYQYYDPELAKLPFHTVLTLAYQICFTLGWGNVSPLFQASRIFTLPYAAIGIPLTFACAANYGRLLAKGFCIDWMFLSSVLRHNIHTSEKPRQMPLKRAFNLLVFHQLLGVVLFNTIFDKLGVINAWYLVFLSSTRLGLGDIIPNPANIGETIGMLFYFTLGNICMQAFLISICYHIQRLHFVLLKLYLFKAHFYLKKKLNG